MSDDLREYLERLANRVDDRAEPLAGLQRVRARRVRTRRLTAATLALVVGVAGTLVVVRAFDDVGDVIPRRTEETWQLPDVLTIWPEGPSRHITVDPADIQAAVDAGDATQRWRTDPREVALRFAKSVLSWEVRSVSNKAARMDQAYDTPVRSFRLSSCPRSAACYVTYIQDVYVVQPSRRGAGGIWSVAWVRGGEAGPEVVPGTHLAEHEVIRFSRPSQPAVQPFVGLAWFDGCGAGRTAQRRDEQPTISLSTLSTSAPDEDCPSVAAGIAFSVSSDQGLAGRDVIDPFGGGADLISALPFTFDLRTKAVVGIATYEDQLGWSIDYPADWSVLPIDEHNGGLSTVGAAFSDGPMIPLDTGTDVGGWPDPSKLSPDQVVVMVIQERQRHRLADDSPFPLRPMGSAILNGGQLPFDRLLSFRGDGLRFAAWWGAADRDQAKRHVMEQMIRTIRFQPWRTGEERHGFVSVGPKGAYPEDRSVPVSAGRLGTVYVFFGKGNTYVLDLEPDSCGEGENRTWDAAQQEILIECPDGTEVRYLPSGSAKDGNPDTFRRSLAAHPLVVSWDGHLLVALNVQQQ